MSSLLEQASSFHRTGKIKEAEAIYKKIISESPNSFEANHALGAINFQLKNYKEAISWTKKALNINSEHYAPYNNLGASFLALEEFDNAINAFSKAIKLKPDYAQAYHSLGIVYKRLEQDDNAIINYERAIKLKPDYAEAYNSLGIVLIKKKEFVLSEINFNKAIKLKPNYAESFSNLGLLNLKLKKHNEAINDCKKAINLKPDYAEAYSNLGAIYLDLKKYEESLNSYNEAIKLKPDYAGAYNDIAIVYKNIKKYEISIEYFNKAIKLKPDYHEAYSNLGTTYQALERSNEAINCCKEAINLKPDYAEAYNNLGVINLTLRKYEKTLDYFNEAIKLKPDYAEAHNNLGAVYLGLKKNEESLNSYNEAIKLKPDYAEAYYNRSVLYAETKRHHLAISDIYKAIKLEPANSERYGHLLGCKNEICEWVDLKTIISFITKKILEENRKDFPIFPLLNHIDSLSTIKKLLDFDNNKKKASLLIKNFKNKKISIAYFSGDFKEHPVGLIVSKLFSLHNKKEFEIFGFSSNPQHNPEDNITKDILNSLDKFYDISKKSDEEIISDAKNCNIDIAIDLTGHTAHGRLSLFRKRIAPIQINFLGYPGTTGEYNDYIIGDKNLIPEESKKFYFEKIIYMPEYFLPNNNKESLVDEKFNKKSLNISEESLVFACFNNCPKINPFIFNCWMRILKKVKNSVILLIEFNPFAKENLKKEALKRDIDPSRLIFSPIIDFDKRLLRYKFCDLFLDTFPYTAHSTANECLWSGIPLLTLAGESFQSRVSLSLLKNLKMEELISYNIEEYEKKAIDIASNRSKLKQIKDKLGQSLKRTSVFNMSNYVKNLEKGYIEIYEKKKKGEDPNDVYIN
jgi:predicted O-linked N-acetylglucosamine transferase (SPINDLY family)